MSEDTSLTKDEWVEIVGEFVAKLGELAHDTYRKLHPAPDGSTLVLPTTAEPFCGMLSDGVIGLLLMLNQVNHQEADKVGMEKFDVIPIFTQELFVRLTSMGYTTAIDPIMDPEAFKEACKAIKKAESPPEGAVTQ